MFDYGRPVARGPARRTQAQRTEATTAALVDAARELFARDGYDAISLTRSRPARV